MVDNDRIKKLLDKVYRLNYWFCNEMLIDEQHAAEFEEACKKANESGEPVIMVSTAEGNAKCMGMMKHNDCYRFKMQLLEDVETIINESGVAA